MNETVCQTLSAAPASVAVPGPSSLSNLRTLEAEAIYILPETAAQFERPVMLYSIGKDSSVMLHLARKAFFPGRIPSRSV
jgi:sulfate adenylyltransferase subunit 2